MTYPNVTASTKFTINPEPSPARPSLSAVLVELVERVEALQAQLSGLLDRLSPIYSIPAREGISEMLQNCKPAIPPTDEPTELEDYPTSYLITVADVSERNIVILRDVVQRLTTEVEI